MEETTESKIFFEELNKEKKAIEKNIKQIEDSIKDNEIKYLLNTFNVGNIFRGWEHIFTSKPNKLNIGIQVKKAHISNNEKLFSQIFEIQQENLINNDNKNNNNCNNISLNHKVIKKSSSDNYLYRSCDACKSINNYNNFNDFIRYNKNNYDNNINDINNNNNNNNDNNIDDILINNINDYNINDYNINDINNNNINDKNNYNNMNDNGNNINYNIVNDNNNNHYNTINYNNNNNNNKICDDDNINKNINNINDINKNIRNKINNNINNFDYFSEGNKKDNKFNDEKEYKNNLCNRLSYEIKSDYLLKNEKEDKKNKEYIHINDLLNKKYDNLQNNNLNNFRYYCDYKKNNIDNNRNIQKSYSLDNFNISKGFRASTPCNRKNNNLTDDFNYEQFKLKVKLGLLKKQIYNKEMRNININKNELNNNLFFKKKK